MQPCKGSSCRKLWGLSEAREDSFAFRRSAVVEELCCLVKELQVETNGLCLIREDEKEITQFFSETLLFQEAKLPTVAEGSVPIRLERRNSFDVKD